jgi:ubiquinone/menaquinone biosynthesis C-methylase UbiE
MLMVELDLYEYIFSDIVIAQKAAVLDVGCSKSKSLCYMREKYSLTGDLIGIDKRSKDFEDTETQKMNGITLIVMNASEKLGFPDNAFDFIFHKDALECITDIDSHIQELHRILKPNGQIVCVHRDWESIICNGSNKKLINKAIYGYANFLQESWMDACDGWMGRRLFGLFNKTGLFESSVKCFNDIETEFIPGTRGYRYISEMNYFLEPKGFLSQAEYDELISDVAAAYQRGEYLFSAPFYIYKGVKISEA